MNIEKRKPAPVFVIGSARSGTSILSKLLREYLNVSFGTESQFIIRYYKRISRYGDLKQEHNLKALLEDLKEERCFKRWKKFGYQIDMERIIKKVKEKSYSGILEAIFTDLADHNNMPRWGDKTPEYIYDLDILYELFPQAKFIHIIRDGRDVALSKFKTHFGAKNICVAALEWHKQIECVSKFEKIIKQNQFFEIKYENFIENPVKTFFDLMQFLEIEDKEGLLRKEIKSKLDKELNRNNSYKWKTQLKHKHQVLFEKVNYHYLKYYEYPTITDGAENITSTERIFYWIDHKTKQLKRIDTWKDNYYKLRIRLRYVIKSLKSI